MAVIFAAFLAAGIAADSHSGDEPSGGAAAVAKSVAPIAHEVEQVRGLRFEHVPQPAIVTPAQTRDQQLGDLDKEYPPAQRRADETVLETLGLVPKGTDLRNVLGSVASDQVAGFYDTKRKHLAIVDGPTAGDPVLTQITLAHELDHALDDQHFHLRDETASTDDGASAYTALVEGTATAVMDDWAHRFVSPGAALVSAFSAIGAAGSTGNIPPYLQRSLEFSYTGGENFVSALRRDAGGSWRLVNRAFAKRPPVSTEQVIHPDKYLHDDRPLPVKLPSPGAGWRRASHGTLGEFDTAQLLRIGNDPNTTRIAAAGWGGGSYALWERGGATVLLVRWRWDTPRDAREFDAALPLYLKKVRPDGSGAALAVAGNTTTLAFAPTRQQAAALAAQRR